MQTGEDVQGLRKTIDFTRLLSISILVIHFYFECYTAFQEWGLTASITEGILDNIYRLGFFNGILRPKMIALILLLVSLVGANGKKDEKISFKACMIYVLIGLLFYFITFH